MRRVPMYQYFEERPYGQSRTGKRRRNVDGKLATSMTWSRIERRFTMIEGRVAIIPFLQGKRNFDGTITEPDIDAIFQQWLARHPEFQGAERDYRFIRGQTMLVDEDETLETVLVRVTAAVSPDLEGYDPAEDSDLYQEFLVDQEPASPREFHKIWIDQCEAAEQIQADHGTDKAMGYLIGEKLLNFLEIAETRPEWRAEIPHFIAEVKAIFQPWQIAEFFGTPRRLGALGHAADEDAHQAFRTQMEDSEHLREDTHNLLLFECVREWLLD